MAACGWGRFLKKGMGRLKYAAAREEMQAIDACSIQDYGIPGIVLMEKAAMAMESILVRELSPEKKIV